MIPSRSNTWPTPWAVAIVLGLLVVMQVLLFVNASLVTDSGRDLANAWAMGHGGPYSPYGPGLFGHWKLGPVWFGLLALPLRLGTSLTQVAVFVGLLAAAKIPLAWGLGRSLVDARLGLLAAVLIALPGWVSESTLVISHTSVVETAVLATLWPALLAWRQRRAGMALLATLMLALALHAHPTTLITAPAVALALWRAVVVPRRWFWLSACVVVFVVPFLPALLAEMQAGWPQAGATASWLHEAQPLARLQRLPEVLVALLAGGAWLAGNYLLPEFGIRFWWLAHAGILILAVVGGLRLCARRQWPDAADQSARAWLLGLVPVSLVAIVFILLLRDATPSWMVYALAPCGVFLLALGWRGLPWDWTWAKAVVGLLLLASIGTGLGELHQRQGSAKQGQILLPAGGFDDIANWHDAGRFSSPWLSIPQFDALAREACAGSEPLTLHGELAMSFDFSQGVAARLHCPADQLPRLAGQEGTQHLAGIPLIVAKALGFDPVPSRYGHVLRVPQSILAPVQGRLADVDVRYRPDRQAELDAAGDQVDAGQVLCPPGAYLVVTNLMPVVNRLQVRVRTSGDENLVPRLTTLAAQYYACDGEPLDWQIHSPDLASIDLVVMSQTAP